MQLRFLVGRRWSEERTREVVELIMADVSVRAPEPKIPIRKLGVEQSEDKTQVDRAALLGAVIDRVIAEFPGGDEPSDDATEVVLRAALL